MSQEDQYQNRRLADTSGEDLDERRRRHRRRKSRGGKSAGGLSLPDFGGQSRFQVPDGGQSRFQVPEDNYDYDPNIDSRQRQAKVQLYIPDAQLQDEENFQSPKDPRDRQRRRSHSHRHRRRSHAPGHDGVDFPDPNDQGQGGQSMDRRDVDPSFEERRERRRSEVVQASRSAVLGDSGQKSRQSVHRHHILDDSDPETPTEGFTLILYSKLAAVIMNFLGLLIGLLSLFIVPILYLIIPRSFFGPAESLQVAIFIILPLFGLGISYLLIVSYNVITWKKQFYKIGYIFNGSLFEIFFYALAFIYILWVTLTTTDHYIKTEMTDAIVKGDLNSWHDAQRFFKCCGIKGVEDWKNYNGQESGGGHLNFPLSCCKNMADKCPRRFNETETRSDEIWNKGCADIIVKISTILNHVSLGLMGLGFLMTIIGFQSVREAFRHKHNPKHRTLFYEPNWLLPLTRGPKYFRRQHERTTTNEESDYYSGFAH